MKQYVVDAFTDQVFGGNPAAVCLLERWPADELLMKITRENNLSETAFAVPEGDGYHLRWFTPGGEIDLCGHATLPPPTSSSALPSRNAAALPSEPWAAC